MVSLRDRAAALETKFAYEQSWLFLAQSRRNKLIGLWAGESLGLSDPHEYARCFAEWAVEHPSEEGLILRLQQDFAAAAVDIDLDGLSNRMHDVLVDVLNEMHAG
ncbi:ATPase inhibitor subunit zeta [Rhizobium sp. FY34]|uniref:ATPase inhibitor subunit zeta n=1 Tax=Rhizobium sp. FY34 TaxID=2562309 RepID=UPI0010C00376|nr:ATPase inhibitor subunit zeta [Rhizobium sp. FY34]